MVCPFKTCHLFFLTQMGKNFPTAKRSVGGGSMSLYGFTAYAFMSVIGFKKRMFGHDCAGG